MRFNSARLRTVPVTLLIASLAAAASARATTVAVVKAPEALGYAFRFASAIDSDGKDRAAAQQAIVEDVAAAGALDEASKMADGIEGWRRGAAYAVIAGRFAAAGRSDRAAELLARTRAISASASGWPVTRLDAQIAEVEAALGHADAAKQLARDVAAGDPRQYQGRSAATAAAAAAAQGDFTTALATLRQMDDDEDVEVARWRTDGYAALAADAKLSREQRKTALEAALRSTETLFGWQRSEALEVLAKQAQGLDAAGLVRPAVARAETVLMPAGERGSPAIACGLARTAALLGDTQHARELLKRAEDWVPYEQDIDQPGVRAFLAGGWRAIGEEAEATRLYTKAIEGAAALKNARPRALAAVEICRSLGKSSAPLSDETKHRLDALLQGLTAAKS